MVHLGLFTLVLLQCCLHQAASEVHCITADSTKLPCVTLSQFATDVIHFVSPNSTLILLPGKHYLTLNLTLSNMDNFSITSENLTAQIVCTDYSHIIFNSSQCIHVTNLEFIGCGGNMVENVLEFVVRNSTFKGEENNEAALELVETVAEIFNSTFISNRGKMTKILWYGTKSVGGAIIANQSNANISQCIFNSNEAEVGGAIFVDMHSNIILHNCFFINNTATWGGVLYSDSSNITIEASEFENNTATYGGVLLAISSNITKETSKFVNNAAYDGGVLYPSSSNVTIETSEFDNNTAINSGGVLYSFSSNITIEVSEFDNNTATYGGVLLAISSNITTEASLFDNNTAINSGGVLYPFSSNITIEASEFDNNTATDGGVLYSSTSNVTIETSEFDNNTANNSGGVLYSFSSNITIEASEFDNNTATWGGVLFAYNSSIMIETSEFDNNTATNAGVLYSSRNNITIETSGFDNNTATWGGVLFAYSSNITIETSEFDNNIATRGGLLYLLDSNIHLSGNKTTFSNNMGSLMSFNSNLSFIGNIMFANNQRPLSMKDNVREGGAFTLLHSNAFLDGSCKIEHSQADNGGAIFSAESKLYVNGNVTIAHNVATKNGGGVYLLNSVLNCQEKSQFLLINNTATNKGGGLHAISSFVKCSSSSGYLITNLIFNKNTAERGGGLSLDSNAKLYILKVDYVLGGDYDPNISALFTANTADYGGAVYVDDDTNSGSCADDRKTECFFQVLTLHAVIYESLWTKSIHFSDNKAYFSGSILYGGLLDRCAVSHFAEVQTKHWPGEDYDYVGNGINYFNDVSMIENHSNFSISSAPVQVCLCIDNEPNCTYQMWHTVIRKGESFNVSLVAVDQIGNPVDSTIQASLNFTESGIAEGQLAQKIAGECTNLTFNVISPQNTEALTLYTSNGPCRDVGISKKTVTIDFLPCSCPVGLQSSGKSDINCTCDCHSNISQYVEDCNSRTGSFVRKPQTRAWISYINHTGYLVYSNCPFDYCSSSTSPINLNLPNGVDAQCAFNHSSLLCGSCHSDLSLSLGSSRCVSCPSYWPALFLIITIAAVLAGIALVTVLLVLNMSVAVGTLNGLIFYANVVYANKSILLPFQESNLLLVFMSWLNLELGIDTCYFPGMDTYIKTWLQMAFPAYIILLVVLVIIISSYSIRFTNLIGKKDPVATLATLILLSYAKLLEICFKSLSVGILKYPDGSLEMLWLPDATVKYLSGKHIPLFIMAVLILLVGLVYTTLLFSWQWLLLLPRWRIFKWSRNPKLQTFIQTYDRPYTSKCRYWTGLLLLARVVLYLVAALNVSNDPHVALVAIIFIVSCIKGLIGSSWKIYNKWLLGVLETFFCWNILLFAAFTWYTIDKVHSNQEAVSYTSVIITFLVLLLIILYHVYTYTTIFSKVKTTKLGRMIDRLLTDSDQNPKPQNQHLRIDQDIHRFNELLDMIDRPVNTNDYNMPHMQNPVQPTHSVVEVHKPFLAPPDAEDADTQYLPGTAQAVQLKVAEENKIQTLEMEERIESETFK